MVRPAVQGSYEGRWSRPPAGLPRRRPLSPRMSLVHEYMIQLVRGAGLRSALAHRAGFGDFTLDLGNLKCRAGAAS